MKLTKALWLVDDVLDALTEPSSMIRLTSRLYLAGYVNPEETANSIKIAAQRQKLTERLRQLKRAELVETRGLGQRMIVSLTKKGRCRLLKKHIREAPRRLDGKSIVVIFDIPEVAALARDAFRYFLKTCGFKKLQQSVWAIEKDVAAFLVTWAKDNRVEKWIRILIAEDA